MIVIDQSVYLARGTNVEAVYISKSLERCIVGVDELAPGKWRISFSDMVTEVIGEGPKTCTQELSLSQPYLLRTLPVLRIKGLALQMWVF